ncbi:MAG TPA: lytic transglycosylase domain-containing protein [Hyphomicrobiales bacterium]|nr:lytic transglycosylase domain-containing protein [Hyphomicrobiales bacterium]
MGLKPLAVGFAVVLASAALGGAAAAATHRHHHHVASSESAKHHGHAAAAHRHAAGHAHSVASKRHAKAAHGHAAATRHHHDSRTHHVAAAVPMPAARPEARPPAAVAAPLPVAAPASVAPVREAARVATEPRAATIVAVKSAYSRLQAGDLAGATAIGDQISAPAAHALVEWLAIRSASRQVGFRRIAQFLHDYPSWPDDSMIRRRAEEALYLEDSPPAEIRAFLAASPATTPLGRLAAARAALAAGDARSAALEARRAWRDGDFSAEVQKKVLSEFGRFLQPGDQVARAERLFYDGDVESALRAAARAPAAYQAVARARAEVARRRPDAKAALDAVPADARGFAGYLYALTEYNLAANKPEAAAAATLKAPRDAAALVDTHAWWEKRRWLARDLLDAGDAATAFRVAASGTERAPADAADAAFHAGWIALRFLEDPHTAIKQFAAIEAVATTPITRARAYYWLGRAYSAAGRGADARAAYQKAAQFSTTYYGELAGAEIGRPAITLHPVPGPSPQAAAAFRRALAAQAIDLLYAIGANDLTTPLYRAMADQAINADTYVLLAAMARDHHDSRALLMVGKSAVAAGYPLESLAWPTAGIPSYHALGDKVEAAVVYAIARQESAFHAAAVSAAGARGLLQLMPATARRTAKAVGVRFDAHRLTTDPAYNAALGSAHLGHLMAEFDGSYLLTFAAYNAGSARVQDWIKRYGDPRNPQVDPVDWVERIPFTETRNYVQRVMENVEVYRARLDGHVPCNIVADLRRGQLAAR